MKRISLSLMLVLLLISSSAFAGSIGYIETDRFGYTGSIYRYASMEDLQNETNLVETISVGNRDLSIYNWDNYNIFMGSWWYSTEGKSGWGNTRGNSGVGFIQMYDEEDVTATHTDFSFGGFDGTYYTEFDYSVTGGGADYDNAYARFWTEAGGSGKDVGIFHEYELMLTAYGLEGAENGAGWIVAENEPGSVNGYLRGVFENVSTSAPELNGLYAFDLTLDMDNWAYENMELLDPYSFTPSQFGEMLPTPEPSTFLLLGAGLAGLIGFGRKRMAS